MQIPDLILIAYDHFAERLNRKRVCVRDTRGNTFYGKGSTEIDSNLHSNSGKLKDHLDPAHTCSKTHSDQSNCTFEEMPMWAGQKNIRIFLEKEIDRQIDAKMGTRMVEFDRSAKSKISI